MPDIKEGDPAPDFELPTDDGGQLMLSKLRGRPVVIYFYPADDTEGCTLEAIDFTRLLPEFEAAGAVVVGISPDTLRSHERFRAKHGLKATLASDAGRTVVERYGVWREKQMFGRKFMGVARDTFLIGANGKVARIWRKTRVKGHAENVLAAVRAL